ncbi:MAG: hypothetical protein ACFFCI_17855 [Promethearchaeota archaeon]
MSLVKIYNHIKQMVIEEGYQEEIESFKKIPSLEEMSKWYFFSEYCYVALHAGISTKATRNIYDAFWNNGDFNFDAITNKSKHEAIKYMYHHLDFCFNHYKTSKNKLKYLESLKWIGSITKNHLARNLGLLQYAKSDRHLVRIASLFHYKDAQELCDSIAKNSEDKPGIIDLVLWRFAINHDNYLELIQNLTKKPLQQKNVM